MEKSRLIFSVTGNIYGISYRQTGEDRAVISISIETPPTGFPQHLMLTGVG